MNLTEIITHRDMLGCWLNERSLLGEGAEVGSERGQFARHILKTWRGQRIYLIDPWANLITDEYPQKHDTMDFEGWYQECEALSRNDPRAVLMRSKSVEAASTLAPLSLDFVYIDAAHDYRNVLQDVDAWYPKLKTGGILGGHDFYDSPDPVACCHVASAVIRWMRERNLSFTVTPCTSWWTIK